MNFLYLQNRYRKKNSQKKKSLTFDHQKDEHYQLYEKGFYSFFHPWRLFSCTFGHKNDDVRQGLSLQGFTLKFPLRSLYTCRKVEWSKVTTAMLMLGLKKEPFQGNFSLLFFFFFFWEMATTIFASHKCHEEETRSLNLSNKMGSLSWLSLISSARLTSINIQLIWREKSALLRSSVRKYIRGILFSRKKWRSCWGCWKAK